MTLLPPVKSNLSPFPMRILHHIVYVIELDQSVLSERIFQEANPNHNLRLPCLYVGSTGLTAGERFKNHCNGHKSNKCVRNYSIISGIRPDICDSAGRKRQEPLK